MGRAQAEELFESLQEVDKNIKVEATQLDKIDEKKKSSFYSKVSAIQKEVPILQKLWAKLQLNQVDNDPIFKQIQTDMRQIQDA